MRSVSYIYLLISASLLLCFCFFEIEIFIVAVLLTILTIYPHKRHQDYIQNETKTAKTYDHTGDFKSKCNSFLSPPNFPSDFGRENIDKHLFDNRSVNLYFETPSIMWHKNVHSRESSPSPSKPMAKMKLNSTMPLMVSSPMSTRQRSGRRLEISGNVTSAAGPLLSTPFIPQIKRALGLEPSSPKYR